MPKVAYRNVLGEGELQFKYAIHILCMTLCPLIKHKIEIKVCIRSSLLIYSFKEHCIYTL